MSATPQRQPESATHSASATQSGPVTQAGAAKQPELANQPEPASWLWVLFLAMFLAVFCVGPLVVYFATPKPGIASLVEGFAALGVGTGLAAFGTRKSLAAARAVRAAAPRTR